jgi:hypothetical protein
MAMSDDELEASAAEIFKHFDRCEAANGRLLHLREWALSLFCWDGLLPVAVIAIPNLLNFLLPKWDFGIAMLAVFGPVIALSIRFVIGWGRMRSGQVYVWQMVVFTAAISALFLFEAFLLNDQVGGGPKIADPTVILTMFLLYMALMAIALFPFRTLNMDNELAD